MTNENVLKGNKNTGSGRGCATGKGRRFFEPETAHWSGAFAMVEIQQSAESLALFDPSGLVRGFGAGKGDDVVDSLVRTFGVIIGPRIRREHA